MATANPIMLDTTGKIRAFLAMQMVGVKTGDLKAEDAAQIVRLAGQINENFYAEVKVQSLREKAGEKVEAFGKLKIGEA